MCRCACLLLLLLIAACSIEPRDEADRAWQMAECQRVIDKEARDRCVRRVEDEFGAGKRVVDSQKSRKK